MKKDLLGDRMKGYENCSRFYLTEKVPLIIRVDGCAFHSFTRGFEKPFDDILISTMNETACELCERIQFVKMGYVQSDEISLLIYNENPLSEMWFRNNLQKIVSVSSSIASTSFNKYYRINMQLFHKTDEHYKKKEDKAIFDSRAFLIPKYEIENYFIWRQNDAIRNSINMIGRKYYSSKQLNKISQKQLKEMLLKNQEIKFEELDTHIQRGRVIIKRQYNINDVIRNEWIIEKDTPLFVENRSYIKELIGE